MASQVALVVKNPSAIARDMRDVGSIPGSGRSPGEGHGYPLQYSWLEDPMDRGAWRAIVCGVAKSRTWVKWFSIHAVIPSTLMFHFFSIFVWFKFSILLYSMSESDYSLITLVILTLGPVMTWQPGLLAVISRVNVNKDTGSKMFRREKRDLSCISLPINGRHNPAFLLKWKERAVS